MLEADFQHYYRLDLRHEVITAGCRRLWALVRGLPPDSALRRDGRMWTQANEIAAVALERADVWGWRLTTATKAFKRVPEMPRFDHPDRPRPKPAEVAASAERRMSTPQEIMAFMRKTGGEVKSG